MNADAKKENSRMLAAALGLGEDEALGLLERTVLLTAASNSNDLELAGRVERLLKKTFSHVFKSIDECQNKPDIEVVIGGVSQAKEGPAIFVCLKAEAVEISRTPQSFTSETPIHKVLLSVGAPYICAAVSRCLFPDLPYATLKTVRVDLRELLGDDLEKLHKEVDLGESSLAGAGAVGTAFIRTLADFNASGVLRIYDDDSVSLGNLNRCDFFEECDVGLKKAQVLSEKAQEFFPKLMLIPNPIRLDDAAKSVTTGRIDRLIVTVDSRRARRHLQLELPLEVYDASTTGISEIVLHFNQLASESACLCCIYKQEPTELAHEAHIAETLGVALSSVVKERVSPKDSELIVKKYPHLEASQLIGQAYDTLFKQLCGAGKLNTVADKQVLAPFAFVSALAGTLLALEVIRRRIRQVIDEPFNYWRVSPWSSPVFKLRINRAVEPTCEFHSCAITMKVAKEIIHQGYDA